MWSGQRFFMAGLLWWGLAVGAFAEVPDAAPAEVAWFVGTWSVTHADAAEAETIPAAPPQQVIIAHTEGARIRRTRVPHGGRAGEAVTVTFTVKTLRGTFPWWSEGGSSLVARRVDEDTFLLAPVRDGGRADWQNAWRYARVVSQER